MFRNAHTSLCTVAVLAVLFVAALVAGAVADDPGNSNHTGNDVSLETKIASATVYSHQAQIVRRGTVSLAAGSSRILCSDLPEGFVETSLIVEGRGSAEAQIVGIDFERREDDYRGTPRYKELSEELETLHAERADLIIQRDAIKRREAMTRSVSDLSVSKGREQLAAGTFSMQEWRELLAFIEEETLAGELRLQEIREKSDEIEKRMRWIDGEMRKMRGNATGGKDLIVDCEVASAGDLTFEITYIVGGASWHPEYTVRYIEEFDEVELTYAARISQSTGEDWNGVDVLLSTASPHVGAAPPTLFPHFLGAVRGAITGRVTDATTGAPLGFANIMVVGTPYGGTTNRDGHYEIRGVESGKYTIQAGYMGYEPTRRVNIRVIAGATKRVDMALQPARISAGETATRRGMDSEDMRIRPINTVAEAIATQPGVVLHEGEIHVRGGRSSEVKMYVDAPAISYAEMTVAGSEFAANLVIAKPVELETGAEPKRVLVVQRRIPGTFVREAIPRYSDHVFVRGTLVNPLDVPILAGPAEVYVESAPAQEGPPVTNFVGKDSIQDVAPGEEFTMYLGVDQSLKVEQEIAREVLTRAGSRKTKIRYTVSIMSESFRKLPAELWVLDRVPVSMIKDVAVRDIEILPEPDEHDEEGLLTWKLTLDAGERAEIVTEYTVEFPSAFTPRGINLE
jgi:hypothetical protein